MCRRNWICSGFLLGLGVGMLIGMWINGGFLCHCAGLGLILAGILCFVKK